MDIIESEYPAVEAGKVLTEALRKQAEKPILLMVSGGSALSILNFVEPTVLGPQLTLTVLDERFSTNPTINNFAQLEQTEFFTSGISKGVQTISTKVLEGESLDGARDRFAAALHAWKEQNGDGVIIATMGIGPDGHTAGILPGEHGVDFNGDAWVVGYSVPEEVNQYTERITVTNTFLKELVNFSIVYSSGVNKHQIIRALKEENSHDEIFPAQIFKSMRSVRLFTDTVFI